MNSHKVGLVLGSFLGSMHLVWSLFVAFGWAQGILDFIYHLHSLSNPFTVMPFDLGRSIGLIVVTSVIGYILGNVFSFFWKKLHKN